MTDAPAPARWASHRHRFGRFLGCLLTALVASAVLAGEADEVGSGAFGGYYQGEPAGPILRADALDDVLEELETGQVQTLSMWERVMRWLHDRLQERDGGGIPGWLEDFRLSDDTLRVILYVTSLLIVILAVAIVVNELRHGRGRRASRRQPRRGPDPAPFAASPRDLNRVPLAEQPGLLLNALAERLIEQPRGGACLTHREITRRTSGLPHAEPVGAVAGLAERIRYANRAPSEAEISGTVERGLALLQELGGPTSR